mmetsp:Transcript_677/g.2618  ORF Transcript_677/g.2618 Transcript_677/m.2618 type:complete len:230 (-) Transcript_677:810-1499(-)
MPNPTNVPMAFPRFPTSIPGTTSSVQFFPAASAPAVAGPPTFALDATNSSFVVNRKSFLPTRNMPRRCTAYRKNRYANSAGCEKAFSSAPPAAPAVAKKTNSKHDPSASPLGLRNLETLGGVNVAKSTVIAVAVGKTPKLGGAMRIEQLNTKQETAVARIKLPTVTELIDVFGAGALVAVFPFATAAASRSRQSEAFLLSFSCNAFGLAIESSSRQSEAPLSEDETSAS